MLRKRLTYANVVATMALVFAMSGGALAASHYLITSTKQISPTVLKALTRAGRSGATGATGPRGPRGATGERGEPGEDGERGDRGERGERGEVGQSGEGATVGYSAVARGPIPVGASKENLDSTTLPAGHYIVSANVQIDSQGNNPGGIGIQCNLYDEGALLDESDSFAPLTSAEQTPNYLSVISVPLDAALNTTTSTTVDVACDTYKNIAGAYVNAAQVQLEAVATNANR